MTEVLFAKLLILAWTVMLVIITRGVCLIDCNIAKIRKHAAIIDYHAKRAADALEWMAHNAKRKSQSPERPLR